MKKWIKSERLYYLIMMVIQLILIVLLVKQNNDLRTNIKSNNDYFTDRFYSFYGNQDGEKELLHFSTYNTRYFILVYVSNDCSICEIVQEDLCNFLRGNEIDGLVSIVLLSTEDLAIKDTRLKKMKISYQDAIQFGDVQPSIFAVNGQGEVIFSQKGYIRNTFPSFYHRLMQWKKKESRSIQISY